MRTTTFGWTDSQGWTTGEADSADLVVYFGVRQQLTCGRRYDELRALFPKAHLLGCSTGGQIAENDVSDNRIAAVAMQFEQTPVRLASHEIADASGSRHCGETLGEQLDAADLAGIFILSDGLNINGSDLVAGLRAKVGATVAITGGLAGDGADFKETLVGADCPPRPRLIGAVGFYGNAIRIGHGSAGGWDVFGPHRRITRSAGNVLIELDGRPALDLYERYLGEDEIRGLPGTALLFPLRIRDPRNADHEVVRTVLAVDREGRSMTFAGDVPEGWDAQLMRGNFDNLAAGAADAAGQAASAIAGAHHDRVALMVSCIGRRLLMGQRITEEVEAAGQALGSGVPRIGFYSYGEISPHAASGMCELHNQTMTVTTITEA